jgi:hypothetical protein
MAGIRQGQPDLRRFERYATPMLGEKEFKGAIQLSFSLISETLRRQLPRGRTYR